MRRSWLAASQFPSYVASFPQFQRLPGTCNGHPWAREVRRRPTSARGLGRSLGLATGSTTDGVSMLFVFEKKLGASRLDICPVGCIRWPTASHPAPPLAQRWAAAERGRGASARRNPAAELSCPRASALSSECSQALALPILVRCVVPPLAQDAFACSSWVLSPDAVAGYSLLLPIDSVPCKAHVAEPS